MSKRLGTQQHHGAKTSLAFAATVAVGCWSSAGTKTNVGTGAREPVALDASSTSSSALKAPAAPATEVNVTRGDAGASNEGRRFETREEACGNCAPLRRAEAVATSPFLEAAAVTQKVASDLPGGDRFPNTEYVLLMRTHGGWFRFPLGQSGEFSGWNGPFSMRFTFESLRIQNDTLEVKACQEPPCCTERFRVDDAGVPTRDHCQR